MAKKTPITADVAQQWEEEEKQHGPYYPPQLVDKIVEHVNVHLHDEDRIKESFHQAWRLKLSRFKQKYPEVSMSPISEDIFYIDGDPESPISKFLGGFPGINAGGVSFHIKQQRLFDEFERVNQGEILKIKKSLAYQAKDKPHVRKEPEIRDPFAPEKGSEIGEDEHKGSGMSGGKYHIKHVPYGYKVCKLYEKKCFSKHPLDLERAKSQLRALYANTKKGGNYDYNRSMFPYMSGPSDAARQQMEDSQRYKPFSY